MHPALAAVAARQGGVFTAAQAHACGYDTGEIKALRRSGAWTSLRRGAYAESTLVSCSSAEGRHELLTRTVMCQLSAYAVVSHVSAAVAHGLDLLDPELATVHVTRGDLGTPRLEAGVRHHAASLPDAHVTTIGTVPVTTLSRTVLDVARSATFRQGVVTADAALRRGVTLDELRETLEYCRDWPGSRVAGKVVTFARPGAESVGESLARVVLAEQGLPDPDLQAEIFDEDGLVGRVDFLWEEHRTVAEFDGRVKYEPGPVLGQDEASDVLWREKRREDRLRDAGYEVVRITWSDCMRPGVVGRRVRRCFARAESVRVAAG